MDERWRRHAACFNLDPHVFYPHTEEEADTGIKICDSCVVREACLEYAIVNREKEGTWGGQSQWMRKRIQRRNQVRKARARKREEERSQVA